MGAAVNGLGALSPQTACEGYGIEASDEVKGAFKTLGFLCAGFGIFIGLNAFTEMDPVQAFGESNVCLCNGSDFCLFRTHPSHDRLMFIGYAWIPALIMQIDNNFISKTDLAKAPSYSWLFVDILMVAVCGLQLG